MIDADDPDPLLDAIRAATSSIALANRVLAADCNPGGDRSTRFLRRLDTYLTPMSELGKRVFLRALLDASERRYAEFICAASDDDADATDHLLTICGISQRLSKLECTERSHGNNVDGTDSGNS